LPRASAQVLQGKGHLLPEEAAAEIAPMIAAFLKPHLSF
jgi:hypothetical protein